MSRPGTTIVFSRIETPLMEWAPCSAVVGEPPHFLHKHECPNRARRLRSGFPVCGIHAKALGIEVRENAKVPA